MIIGLSGYSRSGKDTVASNIVLLDPSMSTAALADKIKLVAGDLFDFSSEQLYGSLKNARDERYPRDNHVVVPDEGGWKCLCCDVSSAYALDLEAERCYLTPRYAFQLLGTEFGRHCFAHLWTDRTLQSVQAKLTQPACRGVVITDVRFKSEIQRLKEAGALLVRVKRPGIDKPPFDHPSETEQADVPDNVFDYIFYNDVDVHTCREEFQARCLVMLEVLRGALQIHLSDPHMEKLLEDHAEDVRKGKIREYDEAQDDIPPFKRKEKPAQ